MAGLLTLEQLAGASAEPAAAIARVPGAGLGGRRRRSPGTPSRCCCSGRSRAAAGASGSAARDLLEQPGGREPRCLALGARGDVTVCCAESRPRARRRRAGRAPGRGRASTVELFTDAGISAAVPGSDALLVGADAVGPDFFVNKVGTAALCALATRRRRAGLRAGRPREGAERSGRSTRLTLVEGPPSCDQRRRPVGRRGPQPVFRAGPAIAAQLQW